MTFIRPLNIRRFFALSFCLCAFSVQAATLSDLYSKVPKPPADVREAMSWLSDGKIVQPDFVAIEGVLAAERAKTAVLNGGEVPKARVVVPASIDDSAEVAAAVRSYADYLANTQGAKAPQAVLGKRKRWLQAAFGRKQMEISHKMAPCAASCADATVAEANQLLMQSRDQELKTEIRAWNAMFDDWQKKRYGELIVADSRIAATADGAAATTAQGRALIASYQAAMLDEIDLLLSIAELCVLRAAAITKGLDGSEPDGISGATKKAAK